MKSHFDWEIFGENSVLYLTHSKQTKNGRNFISLTNENRIKRSERKKDEKFHPHWPQFVADTFQCQRSQFDRMECVNRVNVFHLPFVLYIPFELLYTVHRNTLFGTDLKHTTAKAPRNTCTAFWQSVCVAVIHCFNVPLLLILLIFAVLSLNL